MSYLNDYDKFPELKFCPFCGGKVETGRIDLMGEGVLKAKWYADNKSANPDVTCFLATGRRKTQPKTKFREGGLGGTAF